jgi:hypothetical protein
MPAIDVHYIDCMDCGDYDRTNFVIYDPGYSDYFEYDSAADEGYEYMPHEDQYYRGWYSSKEYSTSECYIIAKRNMVFEFICKTESGYSLTVFKMPRLWFFLSIVEV